MTEEACRISALQLPGRVYSLLVSSVVPLTVREVSGYLNADPEHVKAAKDFLTATDLLDRGADRGRKPTFKAKGTK